MVENKDEIGILLALLSIPSVRKNIRRATKGEYQEESPLTLEQMAEWCGISTSTLQKIYREALMKMRKELRNTTTCEELKNHLNN